MHPVLANRREQAASRSADLWVIGLALAACVLGGHEGMWGKSLLVLGLGLLVLFHPPERRLPVAWRWILAGLLLLAAVPLLPRGLSPDAPWRELLVNEHGIPVASSLAPQPWITFQQLLFLLAGIVWFAFLLCRSWRYSFRVTMSIYTLGILALAVLGLIGFGLFDGVVGHSHGLWSPWAGFGFVPNRNAAGNTLALAGIMMLALAYDSILQRRGVAWLWAIGVVVIGVALVVNYSRAGVLIFLGGSVMWLLVVTVVTGRFHHIGPVLTAILLFVFLFLLFGGKTLDRFVKPAVNQGTSTLHFRLGLHRAALPLLGQASWHGIGLGNFEPVFVLFRETEGERAAETFDVSNEWRVLNPENDYLWLGIEAGWLSPLLVFLGVLTLAAGNIPSKRDPDCSLYLAILVGGFFFLLHGWMDVSGHRLASAWPALFLFSLLERRRLLWPVSRVARWVYRAGAGVLILAAVGWLLGSIGLLWLPSQAGADWIQRRVSAQMRPLSGGGPAAGLALTGQRKVVQHLAPEDPEETLRLTREALRIKPMDWLAYFNRALAEVPLGGTENHHAADEHFRRSFVLAPNNFRIPYFAGRVWLAHGQVERAMDAWSRTLFRARPEMALHFFRMMSHDVRAIPEARRRLGTVSRPYLNLYLHHLERLPETDVAAEIADLLRDNPGLDGLSDGQRRRLFAVWARKGDRADLEERLLRNAGWLPAGWRWVASTLAESGEYRLASDLAERFADRPRMPTAVPRSDVKELRRRLQLFDDDFPAGYTLYLELMNSGESDEALEALLKISEHPDCPGYFYFLLAKLFQDRGDWVSAWNAWSRYLEME